MYTSCEVTQKMVNRKLRRLGLFRYRYEAGGSNDLSFCGFAHKGIS